MPFPFHRTSPSLAAFLWGALYLLAAVVSHRLNGPIDMTGYIWLSAGITMAAFMLRPYREWPGLGAAFTVGQLVLCAFEKGNPAHALLFVLDEAGSAALAVALVRLMRVPLDGLDFVRAMLAAGTLSALLGALPGAAWFAWSQDAPFGQVLRIWAASDFLGVLIVTPVLATWSRFRALRSGGPDRTETLLGLAASVALVVSAHLIFDGNSTARFGTGIGFALTYVPLFFAVVVALLWGGRGGSAAVLVLALTVLIETAEGDGPFAVLDRHHGQSLLEAQLYLGITALLVLLVSALKTMREQLHAQGARWQGRVELALTAAGQLVYTVDPARSRVDWGGDVELRFGHDAATMASVATVLQLVHPDDRETLRARWLGAAPADVDATPARRQTLQITARDGTLHTVIDSGATLADTAGNPVLVTGTWSIETAR
ncbi:MASE1 domain-containing protein [Ralstonia pseudosolanacearum]|uniref:MASE1 domain-containing protein n=1 Tax=Ralstonia pseudosolanacearum TaxID=1310165 RepID=UPI0002C0579E|nr:MASE1 domain-containing protein [Ralstonia pseudosolanacearum]AGH83464.1 putative transmembrane protein [Ralstonia pseudosolanacearum FQY_4]ANH33751.1 transmembrane protein [Ralstonia solanacearum]